MLVRIILIRNSADTDTKSLAILGAIGHSISNTITLKEVRRAICPLKFRSTVKPV